MYCDKVCVCIFIWLLCIHLSQGLSLQSPIFVMENFCRFLSLQIEPVCFKWHVHQMVLNFTNTGLRLPHVILWPIGLLVQLSIDHFSTSRNVFDIIHEHVLTDL